MSQHKRHSAMESVANVVVGYGVALSSQIVIFPIFGITIPLSSNVWIGLWFTLISIVRSYIMRRIFNKWTDTQEEE